MAQWQKKLLTWYAANQRAYPWRTTTDPYKIWLSEIILQQTRTQQGIPYYERFIVHFPTVMALAKASEDEVLKLWQGLGYYSRARNLHYTAQKIAFEYNGKFPKTYKDLKKLKGIGDYTASAIASICFNQPHAVVDGNVFRVLARYFGISLPIDSSAGFTFFKEKATQLQHGHPPATFNQALMDFGAYQCRPKQPLCEQCPFQQNCVAFNTQTVLQFPVKAKKTAVRQRYFHFLILQTPKKTIALEQRTQKGIWKQLYQFPLLEHKKASLPAVATLKKAAENFATGIGAIHLYNKKPILHKLSHQHLEIYFWNISVQKLDHNAVNLGDLDKYAVPVVLENFIEKYF